MVTWLARTHGVATTSAAANRNVSIVLRRLLPRDRHETTGQSHSQLFTRDRRFTIHRERSRVIGATKQRSDRIDDQLTRIDSRQQSRVAVRAATVNAPLVTAFAKPNRKSSGRRDRPENRRTFLSARETIRAANSAD